MRSGSPFLVDERRHCRDELIGTFYADSVLGYVVRIERPEDSRAPRPQGAQSRRLARSPATAIPPRAVAAAAQGHRRSLAPGDPRGRTPRGALGRPRTRGPPQIRVRRRLRARPTRLGLKKSRRTRPPPTRPPRTPHGKSATRQPKTCKTLRPRVRQAMRVSMDPARTTDPMTRPWTTHPATSQSIPSITNARERKAMARRVTPTPSQRTKAPFLSKNALCL